MKACPECGNSYTDDSLKFCLADGAVLTAATGEVETVILARNEHAGTPPTSSGSWLKIMVAVLAAALVGAIIVGAAGILYFRQLSASNAPGDRPSPTNRGSDLPQTPAETPSPDRPQAPVPEKDGSPTAIVDSPGDGFLALRSAPDSEKGERLAQIPHGSRIVIENCEKKKVKIGIRTGRWCQVTYNGKTGWVFDAWLKYQ